MRVALLLLLLFSFSIGSHAAAQRKIYHPPRRRLDKKFQNQLELGYHYAYLTDVNTVTPQPYINRAYAEDHAAFKIENLNSGTEWEFKAGARGVLQSRSELILRELFASVAKGFSNFAIGFQEIPWGETFGIYIADLVNPRDLRDPLMNDLSWTRLPVFAINEQLTSTFLNLQLVYTPFPRDFLIDLGQYGLSAKSLPPFTSSAKDGEFGGKINHTFSWGSDFSLMYLQHWNRNPVFRLDTTQPSFVFIPERHKLNSYIASLSQTVGEFVFRVDAVYHDRQPVIDPSLLFVVEAEQLQTVAGVDYSSPDNASIGFQYHVDQTLNYSTLNWLSAKAAKTVVKKRLETEIFVFQGINNLDFWLQPSVKWTPTDYLSISFRWDYIEAQNSVNSLDINAGVLPLVRHQDRVMALVSTKF